MDDQKSTGQHGEESYFDAAESWHSLIRDAIRKNPQFAVLWREHKRQCKRPPIMQRLLTGHIVTAMSILLLQTCRWLSQCSKNISAFSTDNPVRGKEANVSASSMESLDTGVEANQLSNTLNMHPEVCKKPGHPISKSFRMDLYRHLSEGKKHLKRELGTKAPQSKAAEPGSKETMPETERKKNAEIIKKRQCNHILLLEGL